MNFKLVIGFIILVASFKTFAKDKRLDSVECDVKKQSYGSVLQCGEDLYSVKQKSSVEKSLYQICKENFKCKISFEVNKRDEVTKILSAFSKGKKKEKTFTASFDCKEASGKIEELICRNEDIAKLDNQLGAKIKLALEKSEETKKIRDAQKAWIKNTRDKCQDHACLRLSYENRLKEFSETD